MASESQDSIEHDDNESKEEHIKQRLKEMGVSEDSERPEKSFISKYGKYFVGVIFIVLVAAYGIEYKKQTDTEDEQVAAAETNNNMPQHAPAYGYGQPMQPPAWVQERHAQMQQRPEPPAWVQERHAQMQQRPEPPAWVQERHAQMQQRPEPPAWVQERRAQMQQPPMNMPGNNTADNAANTTGNQPYPNPYYAHSYPAYPNPYWQNNPGYYLNNGYWSAPYGGGYPYYNGWQR